MGKAYASILSKNGKPYRALMIDKRLARDANNKVEKPYKLVHKQVTTHNIKSSTTEAPFSLHQCTLSKLPTTSNRDSSKPIEKDEEARTKKQKQKENRSLFFQILGQFLGSKTGRSAGPFFQGFSGVSRWPILAPSWLILARFGALLASFWPHLGAI